MIKEKIKSIKEEKKEDVEMIVAMINRGYSDFVIDASRDAGATGATVLYGRSSIKKDDEFLNGVPLQAEKEIILILVKKSLRKKVMQEISKRTHLQERGNGVCFCLPVSQVMGLTPFEKKSLKNK
ncbi:MAG: P-II family nitrogen regulator [Christensenellales bacterium]